MCIVKRSLGVLSVLAAGALIHQSCLANQTNTKSAPPPPKQAPAPRTAPGVRPQVPAQGAPQQRPPLQPQPNQRVNPYLQRRTFPFQQRPTPNVTRPPYGGTAHPQPVPHPFPQHPDPYAGGRHVGPENHFEHPRTGPRVAPSVTAVAGGGTRTESHFASGGRHVVIERPVPGGVYRAVRTEGRFSGMTERPIGNGRIVRTYVLGGQMVGARVYAERTYHGAAYVALIPAVAFPAAYLTWAAQPWGRPVAFQWGWQAQPWYAAYGAAFTPYPTYASLDEWSTDYIVALQLASTYQLNSGAPPASGYAAPQPTQPNQGTPPDPDPQFDSAPAQPAVLSSENKQLLNEEVKVQYRDYAKPTPGIDDPPKALWDGHVFFQVADKVDLENGTPDQLCSLQGGDYILRTGDIDDDGKVPVQVRASGSSSCQAGLNTRIDIRDLEQMESQQEELVARSLQAAPKYMGSRGLPSTRDARSSLYADGQATPDGNALQAVGQM